jgi:hypothetical protein
MNRLSPKVHAVFGFGGSQVAFHRNTETAGVCRLRPAGLSEAWRRPVRIVGRSPVTKFIAGALLGAWLATAAVGQADDNSNHFARIVRALERIASATEKCK